VTTLAPPSSTTCRSTTLPAAVVGAPPAAVAERRSTRLKEKEQAEHISQESKAVRLKKRKLGIASPTAPGPAATSSTSSSTSVISASYSALLGKDTATTAAAVPAWCVRDLKMLGASCAVPQDALQALDEPAAPSVEPVD